MSITFTLSIPPKNQLTEATSDGQPDGDRSLECVPTSIASGMQFLTGKPFDGDEIRDAVYGANYVGGTAAVAFVSYCAAHGVDLTPYNGSQAQLVAKLHQEITAGHPCVITMPSQWGIAPPDPVHPQGWTHVGLMCGEGPAELRCMNPWIAPQWHDGSDQYWSERLCFGQIWVMSLLAKEVPMAWSTHGSGAIDSKGHTAGPGLAALLIGNHLPDGTASETPYNSAGDVFVALTDGQIATWTHAENARLDRGGLVVNALLGVVASLKQQIATAQSTPALTPKQQFGLKILDALFQYEKMS